MAAGKRVAVEGLFTPVGSHVAGTVISSAVTITTTQPAASSKLLIQAITQNIRYTLDGTTPTASVGFQLKAGDPPVLIPVRSGMAIKVIEETATGSIQYQWGN